MAFVPVPKDLNRVKTKVMFNLTKRQIICFALAAAVGVPMYFLTKPSLGISTAAMLMGILPRCGRETQVQRCLPPLRPAM